MKELVRGYLQWMRQATGSRRDASTNQYRRRCPAGHNQLHTAGAR